MAADGATQAQRSSVVCAAPLGGGLGLGLFVLLSLAPTTGLRRLTAWFFLLGEVRVRVLLPTGVITEHRAWPGS